MIYQSEKKGENWSENRNKERLAVTLPSGLKNGVKEKLKNSSLTMSDLVEEKFRDFLRKTKNPEALYDQVEEYVCGCGAVISRKGIRKNDGVCPGCNEKIENF
ncbi:MAG: hypothetical protein ABEJ83_03450 [Candidatus Nanohaloarchaea archaeon]